MIRAAAKNHKDVLVVVDSQDYPRLLEFLQGNQDDQEFRMMLAWKAFQHSGLYDCAVSEWLWKQPTVGGEYPLSFAVPLSLKSSLRYGENPHQTAAVYVDKRLSEVNAGGIASAIQHHGKEMSFNNYLDADAAWNCVRDFNNPTCVIVKHTNPCGVASRDDIIEAYRLAVKADPVSAFLGYTASTIVDPVGGVGGIWLIWDPTQVSVSAHIANSQLIQATVKRENFKEWVLAAVYASPNPGIRQNLWNDLENTSSLMVRPWLIAGTILPIS
ncbi:uncharacterized protein LOC114319441 [Camellia sinensis]|uniref:uncharacterized protein LOC114319441 n=1 Tax=Camellia sinensis TaxID=4442 RepID=UPI001035CB36|nr:uncharacterized protein LOC114319441 [Camellia sinensis]